MKVCIHPKEFCKFCGRMVPMQPPSIIEITPKKKRKLKVDRRPYMKSYYYTVGKRKRQLANKLKAQKQGKK